KNGLEYVEHSGAAIESGETSLEKLENQMRHAGAKLLRAENTSTKSVDQTNEERMQENSPLYTMANSLEDALDNILQIMAEWIGEASRTIFFMLPAFHCWWPTGWTGMKN
ncbi:TPA: DUF4055 domain-containing protein, partial [Escherichia coli]